MVVSRGPVSVKVGPRRLSFKQLGIRQVARHNERKTLPSNHLQTVSKFLTGAEGGALVAVQPQSGKLPAEILSGVEIR